MHALIKEKNSSLSYRFPMQMPAATASGKDTHSRNSSGRTALFALWSGRASLTVETALALPVFLFLCMTFVFFSQVFYIHSEIQGSLFQAARYVSGNILLARIAVEEEQLDADAAQNIICVASARQKVLECSKDILDACVCLEGGADGIQFAYSSVSEDYVDLVVSYRVRLPYAFGIGADFPIVQRCRMRAWTGKTGKSVQTESEEMVYITQYGTVYHKSATCTHLKLTIHRISQSQLSIQRNQSGGIYKPCEKCVTKETGTKEMLYITTEGDRYHNTLSCSGLKRSVLQIPISDIQGKSACTRCYR